MLFFKTSVSSWNSSPFAIKALKHHANLRNSSSKIFPKAGFYDSGRSASTIGSQNPIQFPLFSSIFDKSLDEKIAFTDFKGAHHSYKKLRQTSATLASQLQSITNGKEERIAFLCDRDFSFPVTLLATWIASCTGRFYSLQQGPVLQIRFMHFY